MAYRFKLKESLRDGVHRIAVEQIEKVLEAPRKGDDRVTWVHETRKAMKRTRALLKCVRSGLEDRVYREENTALAEIARQLSGLRDRDVMAATMASLTGQDEELDAALAWLSQRLHAPDTEAAGPALSARSADAVVRRAIKALEKAKGRLARLEVAGELVDTVGAGLRKNQRLGREVLARLALDATDENVHDLRKAVQTYQRQHGLVYAVWPEMQGVRIEAARVLAQLLGEAQDLAVLAATAIAQAEASAPADVPHCDCVAAACRERQRLIREVAVPMAERLFAARPKAVEHELRDGWAAAALLAAGRHPPDEKKSRAGGQKRGARAPAQ